MAEIPILFMQKIPSAKHPFAVQPTTPASTRRCGEQPKTIRAF
jgi:hypothetical protein